MLKLGSIRDYPEIFRSGNVDGVLTEEEALAYGGIRDFRDRRRWILTKLVLKELAMEYLSRHEKRYYPLNTIEVSPRDPTGGQEIRCRLAQEEPASPPLRAWSSADNEVGVGFVMPFDPDLRGGLQIRRVSRSYPFMLDDRRFSREEEALLRSQSEQDVDRMTTLLLETKNLCATIFPEIKDPGHFRVERVDGSDRVHLDTRRLTLPRGFDRHHIQSWNWDDYVILLALFYDHRKEAQGFHPGRHAIWI